MHLGARHAEGDPPTPVIRSADLEPAIGGRWTRRTNLDFQALGFAGHQSQAMLRQDRGVDGAVESIAAGADRLHRQHFTVRDRGQLGGSGSQIDDQDPVGGRHRNARADRRGHRFVDQVSGLGAGLDGGLQHRPALHAGDHRLHREHDVRPEDALAADDAADQVVQHRPGHVVIHAIAVAHRPDRPRFPTATD